MSEPTVQQMADAMFEIVKVNMGKKKFKSMDLIKEMREKFGEENIDKKVCKEAIKSLIDSGRCVYSYFGGSYIEIPHKEAAAN
ncbi:MAG: hypothetical protein A2284_04110 [Deltaproteobacteria bacterium RIFOXYA12_FULL_61_11]|nr:MAG: hypothetical protein A2284_04110 [Deltaproteobacteria bacterium RIFOXYA12_FULL_61_11]